MQALQQVAARSLRRPLVRLAHFGLLTALLKSQTWTHFLSNKKF